VARCTEQVDALAVRARNAALRGLAQRRRSLEAGAKLLTSLSYQGVLQRGYALVRDERGRSVRSVAGVAAGQRLDIELADGHLGARADTAGKEMPTRSPQPSGQQVSASNTKAGSRGGNQGSLF
jgi:exodeoxyribonuclease VII large subunit